MIRVGLTLDAAGCVRRLESVGHASGARSVVCAAVSSALRSFARLVEDRQDIDVRGSAPSPGELRLEIGREGFDAHHTSVLYGASALLVRQLVDVADDSPGELEVTMKQIGSEEDHGS